MNKLLTSSYILKIRIIFYTLIFLATLGVIDVLTQKAGSELLLSYYGIEVKVGYVGVIIFELANNLGHTFLNAAMLIVGLMRQWILLLVLALIIKYYSPKGQKIKFAFNSKILLKTCLFALFLSASYVIIAFYSEPAIKPFQNSESEPCDRTAARLTAVGRDLEGFTATPEEIRIHVKHFPRTEIRPQAEAEYEFWLKKCNSNDLEDNLL